MYSSDRLTYLAASVETAVAEGSFREAGELLAGYCEALQSGLNVADAAARPQLLADAIRMFECARRSALSARAHCARRLSQLQAAAPYLNSIARHTWEIRA